VKGFRWTAAALMAVLAGTACGTRLERGDIEYGAFGAVSGRPAAVVGGAGTEPSSGAPSAVDTATDPAAPASGGTADASATAASAGNGALPEPARPIARRRALVVDDEAGIAAILSEILMRDGFTCDIAGNGREARALIERAASDAARYDAVLCDLRMAEEDGPTFFRWLKQARPDLAERIAFVTGDTLGPAAGRFLEECGRPVVEKPFVPSEIRKVVAVLVDG